MFGFIHRMHNRRPLLWSVIAFIIVVALATTMSVWWNVLLVQNDRILNDMTKAAMASANNPANANWPLASLMALGILFSLVLVLGLVYMFLRLIRTARLSLAQTQFIAAVTHELRSPVASLQLMLETIRDETTPPEKRREFEARMSGDLRRLGTLVDQVLDTARLEHLLFKVPVEDLALDGFIKTCVEGLDTRLKANAGSLKLPGEIPAGLAVRANRRLLLNAVTNVLDNAIKYSTGPAEISLGVEQTAKAVVLEIRDRGVGIAKREQKRVFKRFYRAGDPLVQSQSGTGLGLYFARLALRAQGGNISVKSDGLGFGTTFRIQIPRLPTRLPSRSLQ